MLFFKNRSHDTLDHVKKDQLFLTMEPNADFYHDGITFWRELHEVCKELTPGCITVEKFKGEHGKDLRAGQDTSRAFHPDEQTVVIRLKNKETVLQAVSLLKELFKSTGTRFIPEEPEGGGPPQIRTNIDKIQQDKLSVISQFYFDREVNDPEERARLQTECQTIVDNYVKGTPDEGHWKAREGVLPFVSLMGLHGLLRPKERHKLDSARKEKEMNAHHPHGDPKLFKDVVVHVQTDRNGQVYGMLYDPLKDAYTRAQGGVRFRNFVRELLGGDPLNHESAHSFGLAAARTGGLLFGTYEALHGNPMVVIIGSVAGVCFGIDMARQSYRIKKRMQSIKDNLDKKHSQAMGLGKDSPDLAVSTPEQDLVAGIEDNAHIHAAYTREDHEIHVSDESMQIVKYLKRIIDDGGEKPAETHLEALAKKEAITIRRRG